ncbi:hypothetical protein [Paenibacillus sambharensis]|nr:hypothetical protein [Paenibacillus sambharensis]
MSRLTRQISQIEIEYWQIDCKYRKVADELNRRDGRVNRMFR